MVRWRVLCRPPPPSLSHLLAASPMLFSRRGPSYHCSARLTLSQLLFAVPAMRERAIQYYLLVQQGLVVRDPNTVLDALGELFHRMASHDTRTGTLSASLLMRRMRTVDGLRDMSAYGEQHDVHELVRRPCCGG